MPNTPLVAQVRPSTLIALLQAGERAPDAVLTTAFRGRVGGLALVPERHVAKLIDLMNDWGHAKTAPLADERFAFQAALARKEVTQATTNVWDRTVVDARAMVWMTPDEAQRVLAARVGASCGWDRTGYSDSCLPDAEECLALLELHEAPPHALAHAQAVAAAAHLLAARANAASPAYAAAPLNLDLVYAGGALHDIAKQQPRHNEAGAALLRDLGLHGPALAARAHWDIPLHGSSGTLREEAFVYMADKLVRGDTLVGLEERFRFHLERHADDPAEQAAIRDRRQRAMAVANRLRAILGEDPETVVATLADEQGRIVGSEAPA